MEKLALLYEYQQADANLEAFENKLRNTPTRKQLIKLQNYLKKQQVVLKEMENKALVDQNSLSEIDAQYDKIMALLGTKRKDISEYEKVAPEELDYNVVKNLVHEYETTYENAVKQKRRAVSVQKKADETEAKLNKILHNVSKVQRDFTTLKKKHEEELHAGSGELEKLKKAAETAGRKCDPELLKKYLRIKQNKSMPVSLLKDGRCMGCNMELPSGQLAKLKKTNAIVECENCGRILYEK